MDFRMIIIFYYIFILLNATWARPTMQRIVVNNHEWEVPNEPGWLEVVQEAQAVQDRLLSSCVSLAECRRIVEQIKSVFYRFPVSKKYLEESNNNMDDVFSTIFKWG